MKRSYISIIVLVLALSVSAQAPLSFKYQAYLRNADGTIRGNEFVTLQLRIVQGSANGSAVYTEIHNTSTNGHGLVSVNVGDGSTSSNMAAVNWGNGPYFLNVTVNGIDLGTTELLSVPFALYANETGDSFSGAYSDLTGTPNLARVATTGNYSDLVNTPHLSSVATTGSYTSLLNIPTTFTPAVHTHLEAEISDLVHYTDDNIDGTEAAFIGWDMDVSDDFSGSYLDLTDAPDISAHYTDDSIDGTEAAFVGWDMDASDDFAGDMGGGVITNLTMPIAPGAPTDAVNRAYVDASSGSFSGSYNDLTDVPVNIDEDATDDFSGNYGDLIGVPVNMDTDATDDFDGAYGSLTGAPAQIGDLGGNMGGAAITNLLDPTNPQDAATMAYVDALEDRVAVLEGLVGTLITDLDALEDAVAALTARVTAHEIAYP